MSAAQGAFDVGVPGPLGVVVIEIGSRNTAWVRSAGVAPTLRRLGIVHRRDFVGGGWSFPSQRAVEVVERLVADGRRVDVIEVAG